MRKLVYPILALTIVAAPAALSAQSSASQAVNVSVIVQRGLSITPQGTNSNNLDFGTVVAGAGAPAIAANSSTSAVELLVQGQTSLPITVTYDANATLNDGAGNNLTFTPDVVGDASAGNRGTAAAIASGAAGAETLSAADPGVYYVWVGGAVDVVSGTAPGTYTGTWNLSVAY